MTHPIDQARANLAHSQKVLDTINTALRPQTPQPTAQPMGQPAMASQPQSAPQQPQMQESSLTQAQTEPQAPAQENPQQEQVGIVEAVRAAIQPLLDQVKALFSKKEEPKTPNQFQ